VRKENRRQPKGKGEQNRNGWLGEPSGSGGIHQEFGKSPENYQRVMLDSIVVDSDGNSSGKLTLIERCAEGSCQGRSYFLRAASCTGAGRK
jgi:hypothetical protein